MAAEAGEWKNKGNAALSAGKFAEAVDCYTKAIELDSSNHVFFSNRSAAYLSQGDAEKALEDAEQCCKLKPEWGKGYGRKGAALHHMKNYEDAIAAYEEGLKQEPGNAALERGLKDAQDAASSDIGNAMGKAFGPEMWTKLSNNPKTASFLADPNFVSKMQEIQKDPNKLGASFNDPRVLEAFSVLMGLDIAMADAAGDRPDMPDASGAASTPSTSHTAKKEQAKSEPEKPLTEEEKAQKAVKDEAEQLKQKGNEHYKKKEFEQALEWYAKAKAKDPTSIAYLLNTAAVYLEQKEFEKCLEECKEAIKIGRENRADYVQIAKAYVRMGNCYMKMGDSHLADAKEQFELAQMENRTKDVDKKIKLVEKMMKEAEARAYIDPEKAREAKEKGNELFKAGDFPGAVAQYSEAIKRDPQNAVYYANRAAAYTKLTSFMEAKSDCEKALELDSNYVKAWSRRGAIEFFMKEYHKALESYKKGLELDPENAECKDGLRRTVMAINSASQSGQVDEERAAKAMADPEIQSILRDPVMQQVLQDFQTDPTSAQKHLSNPGIMEKINKLIAAGVLQTR